MIHVPVWAAFFGGILSFVSPCVFPLVPAYLGFLAGNAQGAEMPSRKRVLGGAIWFVLGFSTIFVGLGALAGFFGFYVLRELPWLMVVAGLIVALFGAQMILVALGVPWARRLFFFLYRERRAPLPHKLPQAIQPLVIGLSFGLGWTPCIGPILGGILALAYSSQTAASGAFLLAVYSAGLGIPFIVSALFMQRVQALIRRMGKAYLAVEIGAGLLLIFMGALIATDTLIRVVSWLLQYFAIPEIG